MEKKDLENFFDEVVTTVKDGLNKLAEKTDQLTQIGRLKLDIISLKREIEKNFAELGGRVYQLATEEDAKELYEKANQFMKRVSVEFERLKEDYIGNL